MGLVRQNKSSVKRSCDQVSAKLNILENVAPWKNISKLYIGLFKETVRKDMKESNSQMVLCKLHDTVSFSHSQRISSFSL